MEEEAFSNKSDQRATRRRPVRWRGGGETRGVVGFQGPRLAWKGHGAAGKEVGSGTALADSARRQLQKEKELRRLTSPAAKAEELGRVEACRRLEQCLWLLEGQDHSLEAPIVQSIRNPHRGETGAGRRPHRVHAHAAQERQHLRGCSGQSPRRRGLWQGWWRW